MIRQQEVARRGGLARASALTPERRREIATAASHSAQLKRRGLLTTAELVKRYLARLRSEDPDLARFVELALKAPCKYAWDLAAILKPEERALAFQRLQETVASLEVQR